MSLIIAVWMNARLVAKNRSKSFARRRFMPSHASVRSTIQRFGSTLKANLIAFDDLHRSRACFFNPGSLIAAIAADFLDEGKAIGEFVENEGCPAAILNTRRMDLRLEKHAQRVDQNVPLSGP